jgi:hypothetical protein
MLSPYYFSWLSFITCRWWMTLCNCHQHPKKNIDCLHHDASIVGLANILALNRAPSIDHLGLNGAQFAICHWIDSSPCFLHWMETRSSTRHCWMGLFAINIFSPIFPPPSLILESLEFFFCSKGLLHRFCLIHVLCAQSLLFNLVGDVGLSFLVLLQIECIKL